MLAYEEYIGSNPLKLQLHSTFTQLCNFLEFISELAHMQNYIFIYCKYSL